MSFCRWFHPGCGRGYVSGWQIYGLTPGRHPRYVSLGSHQLLTKCERINMSRLCWFRSWVLAKSFISKPPNFKMLYCKRRTPNITSKHKWQYLILTVSVINWTLKSENGLVHIDWEVSFADKSHHQFVSKAGVSRFHSAQGGSQGLARCYILSLYLLREREVNFGCG